MLLECSESCDNEQILIPCILNIFDWFRFPFTNIMTSECHVQKQMCCINRILIPIDEGVVCNIQSIQEHHQVSLLAAGECEQGV
jgi:hypothetical protein